MFFKKLINPYANAIRGPYQENYHWFEYTQRPAFAGCISAFQGCNTMSFLAYLSLF
jgi:hypothetical protein